MHRNQNGTWGFSHRSFPPTKCSYRNMCYRAFVKKRSLRFSHYIFAGKPSLSDYVPYGHFAGSNRISNLPHFVPLGTSRVPSMAGTILTENIMSNRNHHTVENRSSTIGRRILVKPLFRMQKKALRSSSQMNKILTPLMVDF